MVVWWPANRTTVTEYWCFNAEDFQQAAVRTIRNIILLIAIVKWYFNNFTNANFSHTAVSFNFTFHACSYKNSIKEYVTRQKTIRKGMGAGGGGMWKSPPKKFPQEIINKKYTPTDSGQKNVCPRSKKKMLHLLKSSLPHPPPYHFSNGPSVRWPR